MIADLIKHPRIGRSIGLFGSLCIIAGLFLPCGHIPLFGNIAWFSELLVMALVLLLCAVGSILLLFGNGSRRLWILIVMSSASIIGCYPCLEMQLHSIKAKTLGGLGRVSFVSGIFDSVASRAKESFEFGIGFFLVVAGIILLMGVASLRTWGKVKVCGKLGDYAGRMGEKHV